MILVVIALAVAYGLAIAPAIRADQELPVSVTGKERT